MLSLLAVAKIYFHSVILSPYPSMLLLSLGGVQPIPWATRIRIATDVARGISFLHNLDSNVIYRDLKASNILLDSVYWQIQSSFTILTWIYTALTISWLILLSHRTFNLKFFRTSMQSSRILAMQGLVLLEIGLMCQQELWVPRDMLHQNMLLQVNTFILLFSVNPPWPLEYMIA